MYVICFWLSGMTTHLASVVLRVIVRLFPVCLPGRSNPIAFVERIRKANLAGGLVPRALLLNIPGLLLELAKSLVKCDD